jgi:hypothetical protein
MVGWDTVTDICRDKGRLSGEASFASIGSMRFYGDLFAPIYGWFTEGFNTRDLIEAKALLGTLAS